MNEGFFRSTGNKSTVTNAATERTSTTETLVTLTFVGKGGSDMILDGFKKMFCSECRKIRWHEILLDAKCVICGTLRLGRDK